MNLKTVVVGWFESGRLYSLFNEFLVVRKEGPELIERLLAVVGRIACEKPTSRLCDLVRRDEKNAETNTIKRFY